MRRQVGFALGGMIASLLVTFVPPSSSTITFALLVGVGGAGGSMAREPREVAWLTVGALVGTIAGGAIQALGPGGPGVSQVVTAAATVAIVVAIAGFIALVFARAKRPPSPPRKRVDKRT
ncbi:MAG TPA: hypothetical protein VFV53_02030 [Candidatus Limnocylindrales bacterium]|nr:hypothetical protein [Candidatus Limnocylindrales bacterium]